MKSLGETDAGKAGENVERTNGDTPKNIHTDGHSHFPSERLQKIRGQIPIFKRGSAVLA
jgi:hypothetical protein